MIHFLYNNPNPNSFKDSRLTFFAMEQKEYSRKMTEIERDRFKEMQQIGREFSESKAGDIAKLFRQGKIEG
ncbi:MAG: hypothetical protein V1679_01440, partial [Candidatus Peregrinibacteria bacterium]